MRSHREQCINCFLCDFIFFWFQILFLQIAGVTTLVKLSDLIQNNKIVGVYIFIKRYGNLQILFEIKNLFYWNFIFLHHCTDICRSRELSLLVSKAMFLFLSLTVRSISIITNCSSDCSNTFLLLSTGNILLLPSSFLQAFSHVLNIFLLP